MTIYSCPLMEEATNCKCWLEYTRSFFSDGYMAVTVTVLPEYWQIKEGLHETFICYKNSRSTWVQYSVLTFTLFGLRKWTSPLEMMAFYFLIILSHYESVCFPKGLILLWMFLKGLSKFRNTHVFGKPTNHCTNKIYIGVTRQAESQWLI
jgi:hypothetical protein